MHPRVDTTTSPGGRRWYLNGMPPWETPELYQSEAALFRIEPVKTPTHIVQGSSDVRVSYLEA